MARNTRPPAATSSIMETGRGNVPEVVLASASRARLELLRHAGLRLRAEPARVDEAEVKVSLRAERADAAAAAETLAELKAQKVSQRAPGALVIGADQILECEGRWFDKPPDRAAAAAHLRALGGKTHALVTAACVVCGGVRIWHIREAPRLTMRPLDTAFIEFYLDAAGPEVLETVGAYRLEGLGAQLFTKVSGDYFTILGLPLLALLGFLREHGVPAS
jgi:septum formation protein